MNNNHYVLSIYYHVFYVCISNRTMKQKCWDFEGKKEDVCEYVPRSKLLMFPMLTKKWVRSMSPSPPRPGRKGSGVNK